MSSQRDLADFARHLRGNPTEPEIRLWRQLSNRQLAGYKFRRQAKIAPYIADFLCPAKGLVVEIDGDTHSPEADESRDIYFLREGFTTLRFSNADVMQNIEGLCRTILAKLETLPDRWPGRPSHPHPNPSPEEDGLA